MKKIAKILVDSTFIILLVTLLLGLTSCDNSYAYLKGDAEKVILFIGDGMGENHIKTTEMFLEKEMIFTSFEKQGYVTTNSLSLGVATDSAASATALATGQKTYNDYVGKKLDKNLKLISETAKQRGLGVGIVTTDTLSGATPASFSAHADNRDYQMDIIESQLENNIDLYLGAGGSTYKQYQKSFEKKGYEFVSNYSELKMTDKKIIGSFTAINNYNATDSNPTLPILTEFAIKYMEQNFPNGYFLMIEGAHIDKTSHNNNVLDMINYLDEFNNSIETAYNMINNEDVCFIVTADHETGGLTLANSKDEIRNELYTSTDHTTTKVKFYIHQLKNDDIYKIEEDLDNTDIYKIYTSLLGI